MEDLPRRVAIVYDRVAKWGGAEQVLLALHELFPTAPLYTSIHKSQKTTWSHVFPEVIPTFLQASSVVINHYEQFPWLMPLAFESIDFSSYDAVISVTSAEAKSIITTPSIFHLCYCLTPTRYLWSHEAEYMNQLSQIKQLVAKPLLTYLKKVDKIASQRPDAYLAISNEIKNRIQMYYHRKSQIVYPPVNVSEYSNSQDQGYFVWLGRLVKYKKVFEVVKLFNRLGLKLIVIGEGDQEAAIKKIANSNIQVTGFLNHDQVRQYLSNCSALISMHSEDFGINYIEAQASGKPILGLAQGALTEIIVSPKTGTLVETVADLEMEIQNFKTSNYSSKMCQENSKKFSKQRFLENFVKVYKEEWKAYKSTYMY